MNQTETIRTPRKNGRGSTTETPRAPLVETEIGKDLRRVHIPEAPMEMAQVHLVGTSTLILHAFSEKARKQMLGKQTGSPMKKEFKDPEECFNGARYIDEKGRDCIRGASFKHAMVDAASFTKGATKVKLRGGVFIHGDDLLPIKYDRIRNREDVTRVGNSFSKVADLRYRPEYFDWSVQIILRYMPNVVTLDQALTYLQLAGQCIGVGEWRPQRNGVHGTFRVEDCLVGAAILEAASAK